MQIDAYIVLSCRQHTPGTPLTHRCFDAQHAITTLAPVVLRVEPWTSTKTAATLSSRSQCVGTTSRAPRVRGGFLYKVGGVSYTIRILMYPACILHVSCMYLEGYMYPECILMYLKCILNALLHSKRIHVS